MASYSLVVHKTFAKEIRKIPKKDVLRILAAVESLTTDPRPQASKKLEGSEDAYRIRIGIYRVLYRIVDRELTVFLLKVSHRKDVYK